MVIMAKVVKTNASVRTEPRVISELDLVTVPLDGWDNSATSVSVTLRLCAFMVMLVLLSCSLSERDVWTKLPTNVHVLTRSRVFSV